MRLRRLELAVIALTLACICFIGGFFTGRSFGTVSIEGYAVTQAEHVQAQTAAAAATAPGEGVQTQPGGSDAGGPAENPPGSPPAQPEAQPGINDQAGQAEAPPGVPRGGDGKININTASKNELMDLPGIGPAIAERIIEHRQQNGWFAAIEDIMNVSGIAEGRFGRIKDKITV